MFLGKISVKLPITLHDFESSTSHISMLPQKASEGALLFRFCLFNTRFLAT